MKEDPHEGTPDLLIPPREELPASLHWMLIQHTREFDGYHEANALSANFEAMYQLVRSGVWEWHPEAGEEAGRMCCARPKEGWPE